MSTGADVSTLHVAAGLGDLARVRDFLTQGTDVDAKDEMDWTPLYWAASTAQEEVAEFLISRGARIDVKTKDESTPLHQAARSGAVRLVELFISKGADVTAPDKSGSTPLHGAAARGHARIVQTLLAKGADTNAKDRPGRTPLDLAKSKGHSEISALLIPSGSKVNEQDEAGRTVLHHAASNGWEDMVQLVLDRGADTNAQDNFGQTPLHIATVKGYRGIVAFLLAKGAQTDPRDNAGRTPLHYAVGAGGLYGVRDWAQAGDPNIARFLLDKGANINAVDKDGKTPLHYATFNSIARRDMAMVRLLVDRGANVNITDRRGRTARAIIQWLYEMRGDIATKYGRILKETADFLSRNSCSYWVASDGDDLNPGTIERPLKTVECALKIAETGDVILVRGGTYHCASTVHLDESGEPGKLIRLRAYSNETPVFDFSRVKGSGFMVTGAYWHLKGLTITNAESAGILLETPSAHHNILEQIDVRSTTARALFYKSASPTISFLIATHIGILTHGQMVKTPMDSVCVIVLVRAISSRAVAPGTTLMMALTSMRHVHLCALKTATHGATV